MRAPDPLWLFPVLLGACGGPGGDLRPDPPSLDFGPVDFMQVMPSNGYLATEVTLHNEGEGPLSIQIPNFDQTHLCMEGWDGHEGPIELPTLDPDAWYLLVVGVCGYETGERDSEVRGSIQLVNDGQDPLVTLPWSFTPIRDLGGDTG